MGVQRDGSLIFPLEKICCEQLLTKPPKMKTKDKRQKTGRQGKANLKPKTKIPLDEYLIQTEIILYLFISIPTFLPSFKIPVVPSPTRSRITCTLQCASQLSFFLAAYTLKGETERVSALLHLIPIPFIHLYTKIHFEIFLHNKTYEKENNYRHMHRASGVASTPASTKRLQTA